MITDRVLVLFLDGVGLGDRPAVWVACAFAVALAWAFATSIVAVPDAIEV
jgi:hypothetical protein